MANQTKTAEGAEARPFQAEVSRLLDIVVNSLYSQKEIFLRELISNASDACDKLRYAALTQPDLIADDPELRIVIEVGRKGRTLTVTDNGIGMDHDDLVNDLGTIARSGTEQFMRAAGDNGAKDLALIGQFGVGFYAAFMVAERVVVTTRKAGDGAAWRWESDGRGSFTITPAERDTRGTEIRLEMRKDATEFLAAERLRMIVKTYSDHIALPIVLREGIEEQTLNVASALWMRPKSEITAEQYREFYHHVGHMLDEPWLTLHNRAEGKIEYTSLLFVPSARPLDLFNPERKCALRLYVRRVFITDACDELLPGYLRFVRGIVDTEDLPLNVGREMLQQNPMVARIRSALTKRILAELGRKAEKAPQDYALFWKNFGAVLKEGLYEDSDQRADLLKLARFETTADGGPIALDTYVGRMREGQEAIYFISGDNPAALRQSPQLEGFAARGIEVLLLTDPVDDFWIHAVGRYEERAFVSATQGRADLDKVVLRDAPDTPADTGGGAAIDRLIAMAKLTLGDAVSDVRISQRLTDSPVCLVADQGSLDLHLERVLKQHQQLEHLSKRVLEINPRHPLIQALAGAADGADAADRLADATHLLLDQARIIEGEPLADPAAFARRLAGVMTTAVRVPKS